MHNLNHDYVVSISPFFVLLPVFVTHPIYRRRLLAPSRHQVRPVRFDLPAQPALGRGTDRPATTGRFAGHALPRADRIAARRVGRREDGARRVDAAHSGNDSRWQWGAIILSVDFSQNLVRLCGSSSIFVSLFVFIASWDCTTFQFSFVTPPVWYPVWYQFRRLRAVCAQADCRVHARLGARTVHLDPHLPLVLHALNARQIARRCVSAVGGGRRGSEQSESQQFGCVLWSGPLIHAILILI